MYVVSNMALVMKAFLDQLGTMVPDIHYVYDENLSYETALRRYRPDQESNHRADPFFPAFVFKRNVLQHTKYGAGKRTIVNKIVGDVPLAGKVPVYKAVHGWLELPFIVFMKNMVELERFEIAYLAESLGTGGEHNETQLNVVVPGLDGTFPYYVRYTMLDDHLEDKTVNTEENFYKDAHGTITIHGFFLLFHQEASVVREIQSKVQTFYTEVLAEKVILP
jgi:hypothetical protein